jgi:hypothetical protein
VAPGTQQTAAEEAAAAEVVGVAEGEVAAVAAAEAVAAEVAAVAAAEPRAYGHGRTRR